MSLLEQPHDVRRWRTRNAVPNAWDGTTEERTAEKVAAADAADTANWRNRSPYAARPESVAWSVTVLQARPHPHANCSVTQFVGSIAECTVEFDGIELRRVGFPASAIRAKGLDIGGRFIWTMRDGNSIRPRDIDPDVPQTDELSSAEEAELERLSQASAARPADGSDWL